MTKVFEDAEKEFQLAVNDINSLLTFVKLANALRPKLGSILNWADVNSLDANDIGVAKQFMSQRDYNVEVAFNGMIMSLSSSFENFVRRLICDGFTAIAKRFKAYSALTESLKRKHLVSSGYALISIEQPLIETNYDFDRICSNLGNCHKSSQVLTLNSDVFHSKLSPFTQKGISDGFKRIDLTISWDGLGQNSRLQQVLKVDGSKECQKAATKFLDGFVEKRNRIAHGGVVGYLANQSEIEDAIAFFVVFAPCLASTVGKAMRGTS
jgi:hypothetical protein